MRLLDIARFLSRRIAARWRVRNMLFFSKDDLEDGLEARVIELGRRELELIRADPACPWARELGEPCWFDAHGRLFAVESDGRPVSFGWAMPAEAFNVGELGGMVELSRPALWIWACFTPPEFRGRGHYPALLTGIRHLTGHSLTVIYCISDNRASRRGIEKAGFSAAFAMAWHRQIVVTRCNSKGLLRRFRYVRSSR